MSDLKKINSYQYFGIEAGINIVVLSNASGLLKYLNLSTQYVLMREQHQQALVIIEQVQDNSQASLIDIFDAFRNIPSLEPFALAIQKTCLPN